jgi:hypothetical protein
MKNRRISAGEALTKQLLDQLNDNAWSILMVKGQLSVVSEFGSLNILGKPKTVVLIPLNGLKNWTREKFINVFSKTMNASYFEIKFI